MLTTYAKSFNKTIFSDTDEQIIAQIILNDITEVYTAIVRSFLEYACVLWHPGLTKAQSEYIEHIQKRSLDISFP